MTRRYAVQVAAHGLGLLMRKLFAVGKPSRCKGQAVGSSAWLFGSMG